MNKPPDRTARPCSLMVNRALRIACALLLGLFVSNASHAQVRMSIALRNATLPDVFKEITRLTGYQFVYSNNELPAGTINITQTDRDLGDVLDYCLANTRLGWVIDNKVIAISPKVAQRAQATITGRVRSEGGSPLQSVSVTLAGTTQGVLTDRNGNFSIGVTADTVRLNFAYIGMQTREITVAGVRTQKRPLDVVMYESTAVISDVVVTGYGNIRKSTFTGSATTISKDDLLKVSPTNIISSLQVFDPSFRISPNDLMGSDPNTLPEFYVRGRSGMSGLNELDLRDADVSEYALVSNPNLPVFIMDGFEVSAEKIYDTDVNRIRSITILKDASATAIYGSRASNGVIVIETLAPQPGELRVSLNFTSTFTTPDITDYNLMNAKEKVEAELAAGLLDPIAPVPAAAGENMPGRILAYRERMNFINQGVDTHWLSKPLQAQYNPMVSIFVEGGQETVRFGVGMRYNSNNGVMKKSYRNNTGFDFKLDYRYRGLNVTNMASYTRLDAQDSPYGSFKSYADQQPYFPTHDPATGELLKLMPETLLWAGLTRNVINPLYEATLGNFGREGQNEFIDNLMIDWNFLNHFRFRGQFAITHITRGREDFTDPLSTKYHRLLDPFMQGELMVQEMSQTRWDAKVLLTYDHSIEDHYFHAMAGYDAREFKSEFSNAHYRGFPNASLHEKIYASSIVQKPTFSDNHTRNAGFVGTFNYSYRNLYFLDTSLRFDGSSEYGADKRYAPFWSVGVGANIHKFNFMSKYAGYIPLLRLRANYGQTGKVNFPPYAARTSYNLLLDTWYKTGIGAVLMGMGNSNLTWEKTNTWSAGADFGLLGDAAGRERITFMVEWYDKRTIDLVQTVALPSASGFKNYYDNMGQVQNRGFDLSLNVVPVRTKDLDITLFANANHNNNKILKISNSLRDYNERVIAYYEKYLKDNSRKNAHLSPMGQENYLEYAKPMLRFEEGGSLTSIFGMRSLGISPSTGREVYLYRDGSVSYDESNASQHQILGNTEPDISGAFGMNLRYKRLSMFTSFRYEYGGQIYNQTLATNVESANLWDRNVDKRVGALRWHQPGDVTPYKSIKDRYTVSSPTSRFVQDNNYVEFLNLSVSYDFDRELVNRWGLGMLRLSFNMQDLGRLSTVRVERGLNYPYARSFQFTVNASF